MDIKFDDIPLYNLAPNHVNKWKIAKLVGVFIAIKKEKLDDFCSNFTNEDNKNMLSILKDTGLIYEFWNSYYLTDMGKELYARIVKE